VGAAFVQVFLDVDLDTALARNSARSRAIPPDVVRRCAARFERPDPTSFLWEQSTITISDVDAASLCRQIIALWDSYRPPPTQAETAAAAAAATHARAQLAISDAHTRDKRLRTAVGAVIAAASHIGGGSLRSVVAQAAAHARGLALRAGDDWCVVFVRQLREELAQAGVCDADRDVVCAAATGP
jgi:hypothetical protein